MVSNIQERKKPTHTSSRMEQDHTLCELDIMVLSVSKFRKAQKIFSDVVITLSVQIS